MLHLSYTSKMYDRYYNHVNKYPTGGGMCYGATLEAILLYSLIV